MKMQGRSRLLLTDCMQSSILYLVSYCVWDPSAIAPLQDLIPSILPKQSRGEKKQPVSLSGLLIVPAHAPPERE